MLFGAVISRGLGQDLFTILVFFEILFCDV